MTTDPLTQVCCHLPSASTVVIYATHSHGLSHELVYASSMYSSVPPAVPRTLPQGHDGACIYALHALPVLLSIVMSASNYLYVTGGNCAEQYILC